MRKLMVFNLMSLDGYFTGENGDLRWAHRAQDPEWQDFVSGNAQQDAALVFGRVTYDMMKSYWPTPAAREQQPAVAERMNALPKIVFSRSLRTASWSNTTVVQGDPAGTIRELKNTPGADFVLMGSGTIVAQLAEAGLVDEYQFVVVPVVLGKGRTMFDGVKHAPPLAPIRSRTFKNGNLLLCYTARVG